MKKSILFLFITVVFIGCNKPKDDNPIPKMKIGDTYQNGIIFSINTTGTHGTVYAKADLVITSKGQETTFLWDEADKACKDLGNGWRLPTQDEMNTISLAINTGMKPGDVYKDGFKKDSYWIDTKYMAELFTTRVATLSAITDKHMARAVLSF